jgi:hypothetical protein
MGVDLRKQITRAVSATGHRVGKFIVKASYYIYIAFQFLYGSPLLLPNIQFQSQLLYVHVNTPHRQLLPNVTHPLLFTTNATKSRGHAQIFRLVPCP